MAPGAGRPSSIAASSSAPARRGSSRSSEKAAFRCARLGGGGGHRVAFAHAFAAAGRLSPQRQAWTSACLRHADVLVRAALREKGVLRARLRRHGRGARVHPGHDALPNVRIFRHGRQRRRRAARLGAGEYHPENPAPLNPRTERLLVAPIVPTLARLSAPGVLLVAFQSMVSVGDTYFVGRLGTAPLAGLALVFPLIMLLQMTSAGAMGGGVSSAIARALGSGDAAAARRLVVHALVIAAAMSAAFTVLILVFGPAMYRLLGGEAETLDNALGYSNVVFAGAITVWLANTLSSVLRGTGNMLVPALALICAAVVHVPLSGSLTLGFGPLPQLGIAGAAVAYVTTFGPAGLAMALLVFRPGSPLRPPGSEFPLPAPL